MSFPLVGAKDPFAGAPPAPPLEPPNANDTDEDDGEQPPYKDAWREDPACLFDEVYLCSFLLLYHFGKAGRKILEGALLLAEQDLRANRKAGQ